jgi:hypothetical protein
MAQRTPKKGQFYSGIKPLEEEDTFTRSQAGLMLDPPLKSERHVRRYLAFLKTWHPDFAKFKNQETWGLNGERITRRDLIELQCLRTMFVTLRTQVKVQQEYRRLYHDHSS